MNRAKDREYSLPWGYRRSILGFSRNNAVEVVEIMMETGQKTRPHYHREVIELFYVIRGSGTIDVDDESIELKTGDFLTVEPPERHQIVAGHEGLHVLAVKSPGSEEDRVFVD